MPKIVVTNPEKMTIEKMEIEQGTLTGKLPELIGTPETTHCTPFRGRGGVLVGCFCDDFGLTRQKYGQFFKGYPNPVMGPCVLYAEDSYGDGQLVDVPFEIEHSVNLIWVEIVEIQGRRNIIVRADQPIAGFHAL